MSISLNDKRFLLSSLTNENQGECAKCCLKKRLYRYLSIALSIFSAAVAFSIVVSHRDFQLQ